MPNKESIYLLAASLSNQDAISAVMDSNKQSWLLNLTSNKSLTTPQLCDLLHTGDDIVAINLARRHNLPNEVILEILKDPRPTIRHAYLLGYHHKVPRERLSKEVTAYIFQSPWLSPVYAFWLLSFQGFNSRQKLRLQFLEKKGNDDTYEDLGYMPLDAEIAAAGDVLWSTSLRMHPDMYRAVNPPKAPTSSGPVPLDLESGELLDRVESYYSIGSQTLYSQFVLPLEAVTSQYGSAFYRTFFQMMEGWEGSINELIEVTLSVTGQKAEHQSRP